MRSRLTVIYDVSRLFNRRSADRATGIDRVDINYAHHFLTTREFECVFAIQCDTRLIIVRDEVCRPWLSALYSRWCRNDDIGSDYDILSRIMLDFYRRANRLNHDPHLSFLPSSRNDRIYINTSHHGIMRKDISYCIYNEYTPHMVYFIHDIIPITFPEYVRSGDDNLHRLRLENILSFDPVIIANSHHTASELQNYLQDINRNVRVRPIYIGVEETFSRLIDTSDSTENMFITIGTIEPRKNHITLLHVWRELVKRLGSECPKLVIAGARGWENDYICNFMERSPSLKGVVLEHNNLSDEELLGLMRASRALLFPSFEEGWGMPLVEAMAQRLPVIASDIPVFREAGQGLCHYVHPVDGRGWLDAVLEFSAPDSAARTAQLNRLQRFVAPRWSEHFVELHQLLRETVASARNSLSPDTVRPIARLDELSTPLPLLDPDTLVEQVELSFNANRHTRFSNLIFDRFGRSSRRKKLSYRDVADFLRDNGEWTGAANAYTAAVADEPGNFRIYVQKGNCLKEAGDYAASYEAYMAALAISQTDADIYLQLGHLFNVCGFVDDALAYYELAAQISPSDPEVSLHLAAARVVTGQIQTGEANS